SVREIQMPHCLGDMSRLFCVESARLAFTNRAKSAMSRADIPAEHKGCSPVSPALENVWALCFLANRMQVQALNQLQQMMLMRGIAQTNSQPLRFRLTRLRIQNSKFTGQGSYLKLDPAKTF